jgi:predicted O-methyltransferase YrrM
MGFSKKTLNDKLSMNIIRDQNNEYQDITIKYVEEFASLKNKIAPDGRPIYIRKNGFYEYWDSLILYSTVRKYRPRTVIEIGSGYSTRVLSAALSDCEIDSINKDLSHICIEPFEKPWLERFSSITLHRKKIEDIDIELFRHLEKGDLLFIDSSHIIKSETDIHILFRDIFPELKSGVIIHVHDIFLPFDYPDDWTENRGRFWNEQYILEIILQNSDRYEIIHPSYHLWNSFLKDTKFSPKQTVDESYPTSFYLRTK